MTVVGLYFRTFDALLAERLPNVAGHFEALGIHSDIFLIEWMYTLFTRYDQSIKRTLAVC